MKSSIKKFMKLFVADEHGLTAIEYAVLGSAIAVGMASVSTTFLTRLTTKFTNIIAT